MAAKRAKATKLRVLKPTPDPKLVETLERWLTDAKTGELTGVVMLGNRPGDTVQYGWAGEMPLSVAMVTWEQFKLSKFGVMRE